MFLCTSGGRSGLVPPAHQTRPPNQAAEEVDSAVLHAVTDGEVRELEALQRAQEDHAVSETLLAEEAAALQDTRQALHDTEEEGALLADLVLEASQEEVCIRRFEYSSMYACG